MTFLKKSPLKHPLKKVVELYFTPNSGQDVMSRFVRFFSLSHKKGNFSPGHVSLRIHEF